ncbi:MAG: translocation/assembly module TamB domain-containing protein [bacterium]|nr:translocation/assembly module TamB domain-containing protein [bacterium]
MVFGRPFNELDSEQAGGLGSERTPAQQLQQNLQGLAMVFGASGVQNRVAGSIGVDQVQIGSDTAGSSTLVLGKFINPRLLLKYHQSLARSGAYFMTLEYTISRLFKLISTYGQGEEASGVELRWQERY